MVKTKAKEIKKTVKKTNKKTKRIDILLEERIYFIETIVAQGLPSRQIVPTCSKKWGVGERQVRKVKSEWVKRQLERYKKTVDNIDLEKQKIIDTLDEIQVRSLQRHSFNETLGAINSKMKLLGMGKEVIDHTSKGEKIENITYTVVDPSNNSK